MLFISPWNKYFFMRQFDISGDHSLRDDTKQYSNQIKSMNMGSDFAGIPNTVSKKKVSFASFPPEEASSENLLFYRFLTGLLVIIRLVEV